MEPIKILAHSYCFPPMAVPRAIQVPRLLKSLNAQIAVICADNPDTREDKSIHPDMVKHFDPIIKIPFRPSPFLHRLDSYADKFYLSWLQFPDRWRAWNLQVIKNLLNGKIKLGFEPDLLMTFGQPMSDHLFGVAYKEKKGKPWIAHFSDPWVDNPFRHDNPFTAWFNRRLERKVIKVADAVVFTSPETVELVMSKYDAKFRKKAFYIPHCYDPADHNLMVTPSEECYTIRSIGNFYRQRSPKPLFEAIEKIYYTNPNLLADVSIELAGAIGNFDPASCPVAQKFIKCIGPVPYAKSIQLMHSSHCLLVIDAPSDVSVFFPSKLVEYIGANRFILAISPPGTTERIVHELGGLVAKPSDVDSIVRALMLVLEQRPTKLPISNHSYSQEVVGQEMLKVIEMIS